MGKSKKKKNLDFQKVKLKVGRKLQKADNITNASFRSRSIQIVQHIKADGGEPSTKRKLNINDLLSQCQHYNISTRHDSVIGLRELLSSNPQLLSSNLAAILERTSQLFTDKDAAVRMAVIRLLKTMLPNISRNQIQPFFPVVSAYLCCAMTHIYEDVQADSLQVLDLFLDYMPVVVVQSSTQILPNFIEQISRQKNSGKADSARSLSVNPASKMASQKWRTKVLERLHKLLQCIVDCGIKEDNSSQNDDSVVHCVSGKETFHQPFSKTLHNGWQNPGYALKSANVSIIGSDDVKSSGINDEHGMRQFVKTMVPVLMECWMEATTTQTFSAADGSLLTEEAMSLRSNVTKVIQLLWRFISTQHKNQLEWLRSCHFTDFQNYLLQNFPYALHQGTKKKEKVLSEKSAVTLNLGICDIMTYFLPDSSANQTCDNMSDCLETICTYLSGILIGEETMDSHSTKICIQILTRIVDTGIHHEYTNILFNAGVKRYLVCHPLSSEKREFLKFFASVIVTSNTFISMEVQEQFFQSLPELFSLVAKDNHQMAELILCTMKKSACSNCLISLGEFVTEVLADTDTLVTLGVPNHRLFAELLYSLPVIEEDVIRGLSHLCRDDKLPVESCTYIIKCLNYRYHSTSKRSIEESALYISFLLSVILNSKEYPSDQSMEEGTVAERFSPSQVDINMDADAVNRALGVCETVGSILKDLREKQCVVSIVASSLLQYIKNRKRFPVTVMTAVIYIANHLQFYNYKECKPFMPFLVDMIWGFLLAVGEFKCTNQNFCDIYIQDVRDLCSVFIASETEMVEELCRDLTISLKGASNLDDVHVICESMNYILHGVKLRDSIKTLDRSHLQTDLDIVKNRFPAVIQRQWWTDMNFYLNS